MRREDLRRGDTDPAFFTGFVVRHLQKPTDLADTRGRWGVGNVVAAGDILEA